MAADPAVGWLVLGSWSVARDESQVSVGFVCAGFLLVKKQVTGLRKLEAGGRVDSTGRNLGWFLPSTMELRGNAMALLRHCRRNLELDRTPKTVCGVIVNLT